MAQPLVIMISTARTLTQWVTRTTSGWISTCLSLARLGGRCRCVRPGPRAATEVALVAGEAERGDPLEHRLVLDVLRDHRDVELARSAHQRLGEEMRARVGERAPHLHARQL